MTEKSAFQNNLTSKIADFLNEIGIPVISTKLDKETFLPGILVKEGKLLVDEEKLAFPGDLLHEAGHLAVAPANLRTSLSDEVILPDVNLGVLETQAIIWSYAACLHLGIDPRIVFHEGGYKGKSESLLLGFNLGLYIGLNGLETNAMAFSERKAVELGIAPFPQMQKWLRE
ncbi:MAG TPA: hypothetical protein VNB22_00115 [Pyrinomonadaceae bacterium]|jgi:hypothetical protein|nr:hypothetical protein [Pyrinomonadaceae bacterium]